MNRLTKMIGVAVVRGIVILAVAALAYFLTYVVVFGKTPIW